MGRLTFQITWSHNITAQHCSHVISVLSYIGQLEPLGKDAMQSFKEQYWLQKLLRVIPGTFTHAALTKLPLVGLPRVRSTFISLLSSRYRTKLRTIPTAFIEGKQILDHALHLDIPLSQVCTDNLATPFWIRHPLLPRQILRLRLVPVFVS